MARLFHLTDLAVLCSVDIAAVLTRFPRCTLCTAMCPAIFLTPSHFKRVQLCAGAPVRPNERQHLRRRAV